MNTMRIHIIIKMPRTKHSGRQLSGWLEWFKIVKGTKPKDETTQVKRDNMFKIFDDMKKQIYSKDSIKLFEKFNLSPPYDFVLGSLCTLAVERGEPEEIMLTGQGNVDTFIEWLKLNEFDVTVTST